MTVHFVNLLEELQRRSFRMASQVEDLLEEACDALFRTDETLAGRVISRDNEIDQEEVQIEAEVIRLMSLYQPMGMDMRLLCTILKVNNDLERVADCAVNIAERARHLDIALVPDESADVKEMVPIVQRMLHNACQGYRRRDAEVARSVLAQESMVDALYGQTIRRIVAEASKANDHIAAQLDMLSVAKNLERIADHATNIAEDVIFLDTGEIVRHRQR